MIGSLLVANRGEIACRIMRTAGRMGIRTIAVYSEADTHAPHVRQADLAVLIGPAPVRESYLMQERILEAARQSGADAIHPGYGFLSESATFAEAVGRSGLTWVGPSSAAIRAMGRKDTAKTLMAKAGVPVTPGYHGDDQSDARLTQEASAIGYPVLIKAAAGGGGKGMRTVERMADFSAALASARREASGAFGDDRVLIEKYVSRPRHIEVQVFGDRYGHIVHLFERDCSLQRRHQKVIEEAPAPGMSDEVREAVCSAAIRAAKAVNYEGAGTVEFIADTSEGLKPERIWFMEMNTRLQVEHPVTEMITGLDLVEWQLRVASGEPLPLAQDQIVRRGHAIEARLYAESPAAGFLPSTGILTHFHLPDCVRVDTGVEQGAVVTPFYDPMIAKLIASAPTREASVAKLADACRRVEIWPVKTNAAFLARALSHPDFIAGAVDTGFIDTRIESLVPCAVPTPTVLASAARSWLTSEARGERSPWMVLHGFRLNAPLSIVVRLEWNDTIYSVDLGADVFASGHAIRQGGTVVAFEAGEAYAFKPPRIESGAGAQSAGDGIIRSPMPGKIVTIQAKVGETVKKGQALIIVEAMKMEHTLVAPFEGTLAALLVKAGDRVSEGAVLARLTAAAVH